MCLRESVCARARVYVSIFVDTGVPCPAAVGYDSHVVYDMFCLLTCMYMRLQYLVYIWLQYVVYVRLQYLVYVRLQYVVYVWLQNLVYVWLQYVVSAAMHAYTRDR